MQVRKSKRAIIRLIKGTPGDGVMDRKYIFAGMPPLFEICYHETFILNSFFNSMDSKLREGNLPIMSRTAINTPLLNRSFYPLTNISYLSVKISQNY